MISTESPQPGSSRWKRLLFSRVPATTLALLRIAVGLLTVVWATTLLADVRPLLTDLRVDAVGEIGWWQFWPQAPYAGVLAMTAALAIGAISLTVGFRSRASAWVVFGLTLALQRYNPLMNNFGDLILRCVLVLGVALGPSGLYLSVDSFRRRRSIAWRAPLIDPLPLRFVQAHISLGYILTAMLKFTGDTWIAGTAMWHSLNRTDLVRFGVPDWLIAPPVGSVLGWIVLAIELAIGIGVWFHRARPWVLGSGVLLHVGIAVVMELGIFPYVMLASYLAFLPEVDDVRKLIPRWRSRRAKDEAPVPVQP